MIDDNTPEDLSNNKNVDLIDIEKEMKSSFLDYAMSVIVSRALPDVCDGLKPVHRRIIYSMNESGYVFSKPTRKSARIVGDVMGKYHPHGDSAIYDAMVRLAQDFSMRVPLIEGQGNFGSMDGDSAAAMRYTEAKLSEASSFLISDIGFKTVEFRDNYDGTSQEPELLPAEFPNLLINGSEGIAVGMATKIPPHCPDEIIDACCYFVDNLDASNDDLMEYIKGPDFPTGGIILGKSGIKQAYNTGKGSIIIRGKVSVENQKSRESIVISEIPYSVKKSQLIESIAKVAKEKTIEGISDLRDESNREGVRIVLDLKKNIQSEVIINQLYKFTQLQSSFGINLLALKDGIPQILSLRSSIKYFIDFRKQIILKRTKYHLDKTRQRAHILCGLVIAIENIDEMINLIRGSKDTNEAKSKLLSKLWIIKENKKLIKIINDPDYLIIDNDKYKLSDEQAKNILELRLSKLTNLERNKISDELEECSEKIKLYLEILSSYEKLNSVIKEELNNVKDRIKSSRKTEITEAEQEIDDESLITSEDMVVTVTHSGYIKRVPLSTYRAQRRGGKGRSGMSTREEDFVNEVFVTNSLTPLLFFSTRGIVYKLKTYKLPIGSPTSRGKALINLLPLKSGEKITTIMPYLQDNKNNIIFATSKGNVRRNKITDFQNINANGKIAMKLVNDDKLVNVITCEENSSIFLSSRLGKCIRFIAKDIRLFSGRTSIGVRGIKLQKDDSVISLAILRDFKFEVDERDIYLKASNQLRKDEKLDDTMLSDQKFSLMKENEEFILSITDKGYGKRSSAYEYRVTKRGGLGIANMQLTKRNGSEVIASFPIKDNDHLMLVTDKGKLIRCPVDDVRKAGRQTQGVTLFNVSDDEKVVSVAKLEESNE
ncbi:MAG: DNA gyrase subunit A [Rickettsiales bacterium]|nr:DNA gyrase subunit A [Rickettsiales bacterium]